MTNPNDIPTPVLDAQTDKMNDSAQETVSASTVAPSDMVQSLLSSKQYNILKWVVIIVLPAITTVYGTFSNIRSWHRSPLLRCSWVSSLACPRALIICLRQVHPVLW